MKDIIKTASVSGMLTGLVLVAGCAVPEPSADPTVGGSVTGLNGTLGLSNNSDSIRLVGDGNFAFGEQGNGSDYHVTVSQQPEGQICAVTNASGTINTADVRNVAVNCIDSGEPIPTPTLRLKPLNDTGITLCGDYVATISLLEGNRQNDLDCSLTGAGTHVAGIDADGDPVPAGQDAVYGRDVSHNDNSDGHAGFSFTKLDGNGQALPATAASWDCVQDNVTGLIWEVKTNDGGLRDKDWTYTWYNTAGENTGGDHGIGDTGVGTTTGYERFPYNHNYNAIEGPGLGEYDGEFSLGVVPLGWESEPFAGTDNCADSARCDTEKYVADINAAGLCGAGGPWRLPTIAELYSITLQSQVGLGVDNDYFANTSYLYWSASSAATNRRFAVMIIRNHIQDRYKHHPHPVRLVRASH